tara:strand:- start:327 stop:536 length:210 start_codon:yes stop_codon:yes gene_type:complete
MDSKDLNRQKFSTKKSYSKGKTKTGGRPPSPLYTLIGKIEKNYLAKEDTREDFNLLNFKPIKIKTKIKW